MAPPPTFSHKSHPGREAIVTASTFRFGSKAKAISPALETHSSPAPGAVRRIARMAVTGLVGAALTLTSVLPAAAQRNIMPIRDAEIEALIRDYARPVFKAAGLGTSDIGVVLVDDKSFNAFVADSHRIFINVGAISQTDTPNQLIGVIAHEAAHMAGGHLLRLREAVSRAQTMSVIAMLLGAGAMAAGAAAGGSAGNQIIQGGNAIMLGGQSVAERSVLAYARGEETAADRAALTYLGATGQSAVGMIEVFRKFADQNMFASRYIDPYAQTHPMPTERIAQIENVARQSKFFDRKDPPDLQLRHEMAKAKLSGFTEHPGTVARRYPKSDTGLPARYARAIAAYRSGDTKTALKGVDELIKAQPANPWLYELKGQVLFEKGRPKEAIEPYRKAVSLAPDAGIVRVYLGIALTETNDDRYLDEAIRELSAGLRADEDVPIGYRYLAQGYARKGDTAMAELAAAQQYFAEGDFKGAKDLARRARAKLKKGSPGWLRADDIVSYNPPKL